MIAAFFGTGPVMDAYAAALKIPNILRNLLGEGTLSASFVPVYSAQLGERDLEEAQRTSSGVLGIVLLVSGIVVGFGVAAAPVLATLVTPGFDAEIRGLTAGLIRILFPMSGLMIVGAWCLGVLTSHRRFFLPFVAPVLWNVSQIVGLLVAARLGWEPLVFVLAWSTLVGAALQVLIQLPRTRALAGTLWPRLSRTDAVDRVVRNAGPVAAGQGIFQVSSFVDVILASTLGYGPIGAMYFAQRIVQLPMALFGVSVAVAALPEMSRGGDVEALRPHLSAGVRQTLYFILPATVVLLLFGDLVITLIYQRGIFDDQAAILVRWILAGYTAGLIATSLVKLFASAFHALQDTRTPMKYAAISVTVGIAAGAGLMLWFRDLGLGPRAATGLALGGALGAWLNLTLLSRGLAARGLPGLWRGLAPAVARLAAGAALAGMLAWPAREWSRGTFGTGTMSLGLELLVVLALGGLVYLLVAGAGPLRRARPTS